MPTYCVFLGHQPHVSLAELTALLPDFTVQTQWMPKIVSIETEADLGPEWLSHTGGTVLIAREIATESMTGETESDLTAVLQERIPSLLQEQLRCSFGKSAKKGKGKVTFSFRCFNIPRGAIRSLYRECKRHLKASDTPSRYIGNERNPAKPGTLLLRGIPGPGSCELVLLFHPKKKELWIGKTHAVQDIKEYTARDIGKPFRDTKTGLMPPKLAQVMLNLSLLMGERGKGERGKGKGKGSPSPLSWNEVTVWDPFCGSGVIVLEALHRGANVLASDKSLRAVKGCEQNVRFLRHREKTPKTVKHKIWKENALTVKELPSEPTVIVTETSLGPPLEKPPTKRDTGKMIRESEKLLEAFFGNLKALLPTVPVVCTFPVYVTRDGQKHFLTGILDRLQEIGYRLVSPNNSSITFTERMTLLYLRPGQYVGREIVCLVPRKQKKQ